MCLELLSFDGLYSLRNFDRTNAILELSTSRIYFLASLGRRRHATVLKKHRLQPDNILR